MKDKVKKFISAYRSNTYFRASIMMYVNLAINLAYAVFEVFCGYFFHSAWMGTLAFYYIILSFIRLHILKGHKKDDLIHKWKTYRMCGIVLLLLTIALTGMHILTVNRVHTIQYKGYFIYAVATYTFYAVICAVKNVSVYRKLNNPIISASKAINLAVAAISVYSLQSAMITAFGGDDDSFRIIMGNCVGIGVFVVIVSVSLFMIIKSGKEIKR